MQIEKEVSYALKLTQEEFVALYEFLGRLTPSEARSVLSDCEDCNEKAFTLASIWNDMDKGY